MKISLVGAGMDAARTLTLEARDALARAEVIIGAERLLACLPAEFAAARIAQALPERVATLVDAHPEWREVCVLLSGDVGFYSGAKQLLNLLRGRDSAVIPGISTPQYFAARLRRPWQDFRLVSAHGVPCDIVAEVLNHPSVLFLTGGDTPPSRIIAELCAAGLHNARVAVGENLAASDERIVNATAGALAGEKFAPLSVVLVDNEQTFSREIASTGIPDGEFIRGKAPMTKREIRALALSLLELRPDDIAYDIGAGTGSVAVEMALLARRGRIYAVENDADAFELLNKNKERFGTYNLLPISGMAPEALASLPPPRAAFIGGSKGKLRDIVETVLGKNRDARLVISAIALETLAAATAVLQEFSIRNIEVVQLSASRTVARGEYHMLQAENPVFLISGGGA